MHRNLLFIHLAEVDCIMLSQQQHLLHVYNGQFACDASICGAAMAVYARRCVLSIDHWAAAIPREYQNRFLHKI